MYDLMLCINMMLCIILNHIPSLSSFPFFLSVFCLYFHLIYYIMPILCEHQATVSVPQQISSISRTIISLCINRSHWKLEKCAAVKFALYMYVSPGVVRKWTWASTVIRTTGRVVLTESLILYCCNVTPQCTWHKAVLFGHKWNKSLY